MKMRGQIIVLDLLFALLIGVVSIGLLSQAAEAAQRNAIDSALSAESHSDQIADFLIRYGSGGSGSQPGFVPFGTWCFQHFPAQNADNCGNATILAAFNNCLNVHAARRLTRCGSAACVLEVKTCA